MRINASIKFTRPRSRISRTRPLGLVLVVKSFDTESRTGTISVSFKDMNNINENVLAFSEYKNTRNILFVLIGNNY